MTVTVPTASAGVMTVSDDSELNWTTGAEVAPKVTAVAPVKLEPAILTTCPPRNGPILGDTPVTDGSGISE